MSVESQTAALLALVEADRAKRCDAILDEARARAATLTRAAHAEARARMREAFQEERTRRDERVAAARADLQTRKRLAEQQRAKAILAAGWTALSDELVRRWSEPASRRAWVEGAIASARGVLPGSGWRIAHPVDWPAPERDACAAEVERALGAAPVFAADPAIAAGLRIAALGNVVDSTLAGLTADRAAIGARLLHLADATAEAQR
jgi:hypothetical protein